MKAFDPEAFQRRMLHRGENNNNYYYTRQVIIGIIIITDNVLFRLRTAADAFRV